MLRKSLIAAVALAGIGLTTPAHATWRHSHSCSCGHMTCGTTTSTTSSTSTSTGGTTTSTTGGTTTSTTGGTSVPEPGMLGLLGAGLFGIGAIRARRRKR